MSVRQQAVEKIMERCCALFGKKREELTEDTRFIEDLGARSGNVSPLWNSAAVPPSVWPQTTSRSFVKSNSRKGGTENA